MSPTALFQEGPVPTIARHSPSKHGRPSQQGEPQCTLNVRKGSSGCSVLLVVTNAGILDSLVSKLATAMFSCLLKCVAYGWFHSYAVAVAFTVQPPLSPRHDILFRAHLSGRFSLQLLSPGVLGLICIRLSLSGLRAGIWSQMQLWQ